MSTPAPENNIHPITLPMKATIENEIDPHYLGIISCCNSIPDPCTAAHLIAGSSPKTSCSTAKPNTSSIYTSLIPVKRKWVQPGPSQLSYDELKQILVQHNIDFNSHESLKTLTRLYQFSIESITFELPFKMPKLSHLPVKSFKAIQKLGHFAKNIEQEMMSQTPDICPKQSNSSHFDPPLHSPLPLNQPSLMQLNKTVPKNSFTSPFNLCETTTNVLPLSIQPSAHCLRLTSPPLCSLQQGPNQETSFSSHKELYDYGKASVHNVLPNMSIKNVQPYSAMQSSNPSNLPQSMFSDNSLEFFNLQK
ncbi:hypothetical protein O181_056788 [Austropuccinia psidii MF-1]|uniref:Uncharacterized protein n=1 Tax=Austropuccinia psidii MF-1 TaxID=1389203 RepID=A0A9Q3HTT5_9BASI|nr:hypothetical protein [Austropuccinia psidii MF-1]